jgi:2,4-dienoyl-CoA reductase-like NADH-dependent reductase (Old Yellow Enzyme family)
MEKTFQSASIASIRLNNRIIRSATHEGLGDADGFPLKELADKYHKIARGGAGAIITGYMATQQDGKAIGNMRMFDDDRYIEAYQAINAAMRKQGIPVIAQLVHAGGQTSPSITGGDVVAPSPGLYRLMSARARELGEAEIRDIIAGFVAAVVRAKKAGFDGVQIHAAHGYLLNQFFSPYTNRRADRWGGSTENRFRIMAEILSGARKAVGAYPVLAKLSAYDYDRSGMNLDESVRIAVLFQRHGLDALEVSCGGVTDGFSSVRVRKVPIDALFAFHPLLASLSPFKKALLRLMRNRIFKLREPLHNYNVEAAERIKRAVDLPVIAVGGIRSLSDIRSIINGGKADFAAMSRPFIIEPDIVNKFRSGARTASQCIDCGYCLVGVINGALRCYRGKLPRENKTRTV